MPNNNENNYRIRSEFFIFIKDLPSLRITHTDSVEFINVAIRSIQEQNYFSFFSRSGSRIPRDSQYYLLDQLFKELEKDQVEGNELMEIGNTFKKYLKMLKQVSHNYTYYTMTPGMIAVFFVFLHVSQLFFPANTLFIYGSLIADLYGLGFWLFSIWSFSKFEQDLRSLEKQLIGKINFLKALSFSRQISPNFSDSSSLLPTYNDVLLEDAMSTIEMPTFPVPAFPFFNSPALHNGYTSDIDDINVRQERRSYSR